LGYFSHPLLPDARSKNGQFKEPRDKFPANFAAPVTSMIKPHPKQPFNIEIDAVRCLSGDQFTFYGMEDEQMVQPFWSILWVVIDTQESQ
jgi:hypothetical protein